MPSYKLIYFNARGRAELSRWVFLAARQKYEDVRLEGPKWQEFKPSTPFGQLPVLEVDGVKLCQSMTIARFLAKRFKLMGKTDVEEALVNMIVDCVSDVLGEYVKLLLGSDESKEAAKKAWNEGKKEEFLVKLEKCLSSNSKDIYFVGKGMTLADLAVVNLLPALDDYDQAKYPKLKALRSKVESIPEIAKWIASRPDSSF